ENHAVGMCPAAIDLGIGYQQALDEASFAVDRTLDAGAIEPWALQNDGVVETEIALDAQVARVEMTVDDGTIDHQRIGELEAGEIERGAVGLAAEHRADDADPARRDGGGLVCGDAFDRVGGKPARIVAVRADLVPVAIPTTLPRAAYAPAWRSGCRCRLRLAAPRTRALAP